MIQSGDGVGGEENGGQMVGRSQKRQEVQQRGVVQYKELKFDSTYLVW